MAGAVLDQRRISLLWRWDSQLQDYVPWDGDLLSSHITSVENDVNGNPIYIGYAALGSAKGDAVWQIRKMTFASNYLTDVRFANGALSFNQVWDNRAALSYS